MKEVLRVELTEDNLDAIFQTLAKTYIKTGMKDTPEVINSLIIQLTSLVVANYSSMRTVNDIERAKEFAKELYVTLHYMLLDYIDYMVKKEQEENDE